MAKNRWTFTYNAGLFVPPTKAINFTNGLTLAPAVYVEVNSDVNNGGTYGHSLFLAKKFKGSVDINVKLSVGATDYINSTVSSDKDEELFVMFEPSTNAGVGSGPAPTNLLPEKFTLGSDLDTGTLTVDISGFGYGNIGLYNTFEDVDGNGTLLYLEGFHGRVKFVYDISYSHPA